MFDLPSLAHLYHSFPSEASAPVRTFELNGSAFGRLGEPGVLGVINLSPDSWYRESVCLSTEAAVRRGRVLRAHGASAIDVGAESSLAHAARADANSQVKRLVPVVHELARDGCLVSVESYHPEVTRACLDAGARIINLTGQDETGEILRQVADVDGGLILCFVQGPNVRSVGELSLTSDPIPMLYEYFARQSERASNAGVRKLFIDPGLGFYYRNLQDSSTRIRYQMQVFLNSFRLRPLGFPICNALPHAFEAFGEEVRSAEGFFCVVAALGGTHLFRTHEVAKIRAILEVMTMAASRENPLSSV